MMTHWKMLLLGSAIGTTLTVLAGAILTPTQHVRAQLGAPLPPPPTIDDAPKPAPGPERFENVVRQVMPSVVAVSAAKVKPGGLGILKWSGEESGSGVLLKLDQFPITLVATNNHVVAGALAKDVLVTLNDGRILTPKQMWLDPESDIALLEVEGQNLPTAELGNSDLVQPGQWVLAFGSPLGFNQTVTHGIISARDRGQISLGNTIRIKEFLQSDAAINPGSSGGPLIDTYGRVIGINTAIASGNNANDVNFTGIAFSIPINLVRRVGRQLLDTGKVERGYLGMQMAPMMDARKALQLGLTRVRGGVIESVQANGPAAKAGLRANDVILKVDGVAIRDENHFINIVGMLPVKQKIQLQVWRDRQYREVEVQVGNWPGSN